MNVTVIGCGRVGLPLAAGLVRLGHRVVCCERDGERRAAILRARAPFFDAGLDDAIGAGIHSGALQVCGDIAKSVAVAEVVFVAVPVAADGDIKAIAVIAATVAKHAPQKCILAIKSTVRPGSGDQLQCLLKNKVVANPEFLRQGFGLADFLSPSRIVVGVSDSQSAKVLRRLYAPLISAGAPYIQTTRVTAEIAKLAANLFLAARVTLINETADVCEAGGGDIGEVIKIAAADKRIGGDYLRPGAGFGGACLPKDVAMLTATAKSLGAVMPTAAALLASNKNRPAKIAARIVDWLSPFPTPTAAVWGVAFKPDADSADASCALAVVRHLRKNKVRINAFDPMLTTDAKNKLAEIKWFDDAMKSLADADMLVVLTAHKSFSRIFAADIFRAMKGNAVFDCGAIFCADKMKKAGLVFRAIGDGCKPTAGIIDG